MNTGSGSSHTLHAIAEEMAKLAERLHEHGAPRTAVRMVSWVEQLDQIAIGGCCATLGDIHTCSLPEGHDGSHLSHDGTYMWTSTPKALEDLLRESLRGSNEHHQRKQQEQ